MASWRDLSESNRVAAARLCRDPRTACASVSRSYYAVYHEITHRLTTAGFRDFGKLNNGKPRNNPSHENLANHVRKNIDGLRGRNRQDLKAAVIALRERRNAADYRPGETAGEAEAREALRDMLIALDILRRTGG